MAESAQPLPESASNGTGVSDTLWCVGVDHRGTPLDLRERLSVGEHALPTVLGGLRECAGVNAVALLSTCNRLEIYVHGPSHTSDLINRFAEEIGVDPASIKAHAFVHQGLAVVRHLFRVVSSLESMVIGEYQIVHQVKVAHHWARSHGGCNGELDRIFQQALAVAKDVRNQTSIGQHKVSVASVGVDLAQHIHGDLSKAKLLVIGAGEIAELATIHLLGAGVRKLTLINRTHEHALNLAANERFAQCTINTLRWADLQQALANHDIVVTSTAAPRPVITTDEVRNARRRSLSPLVFIDLAVPRDVDVAVGDLSEVFRYDLDHLDRMVANNRELRSEDIEQVEQVIAQHVQQFAQRQALAANPLPAAINRWFEELVNEEFGRLERRIESSETDRAAIRYALQRAAGKVRHRCLHWLQQAPDNQQRNEVLRDLFDL